MSAGTRDLEAYLRTADIESVLAWQLRGAHGSYLLVLVGAVGVLAKPVDEAPRGAPSSSKHEVAAWVLAREIGWQDLVATTVLRSIPSQKNPGQQTDASLQVLWPINERSPALAQFPESDVWRAAVFDALVAHGDRHEGNYLAVPPSNSGVQPRLKLVDHGHAFTAADTASPFYAAKRGQALPQGLIEALTAWHTRYPGDLEPLLDRAELDALMGRAEKVINSRILSIT